jgi:hypothetical protein
MAYVDPDYKTKKELKKAVEEGKLLYPYIPNGMFQAEKNGRICIEGPHYPKPHKWYADCDVVNGVITKVR